MRYAYRDGRLQLDLSVNSKMDQSYEFLSDKQRAYNIAIEYTQNMMDWVTTWVNAAAVTRPYLAPTQMCKAG